MYRLPEEDLDVVLLTNLGRTSLQGLADKLTRATLNHLEPEPPPGPEPLVALTMVPVLVATARGVARGVRSQQSTLG